MRVQIRSFSEANRSHLSHYIPFRALGSPMSDREGGERYSTGKVDPWGRLTS